jgi:hypothetical protein
MRAGQRDTARLDRDHPLGRARWNGRRVMVGDPAHEHDIDLLVGEQLGQHETRVVQAGAGSSRVTSPTALSPDHAVNV